MDASKSSSFVRRLGLTLTVLLALISGVGLALAFAEEPLFFRDPYTQVTTDDTVNTIHFDLTYAMALAAGFSNEDAITLQIWDQLVDSEALGPGNTASYTNCGGEFSPTPDPNLICQGTGADTSQEAWPLWSKMFDPATCITSRFGPYSPFFHFPEDKDIQALHDWAWGYAPSLIGYEAYAWGANAVLDAPCTYTSTVEITTTLQGGSLEAFATYLHSLGDYYSHRDCIAALQTIHAPWGTHTSPLGQNSIYECNYIPSQPSNFDAHGREYGTRWMTDSLRTDAGILAIYAELTARSMEREGQYYPIGLDEPLAGLNDAATLREALYNFVHNWPYQPFDPGQPNDQDANLRRDYADAIANAVLAQRQSFHRVYLPAVVRP